MASKSKIVLVTGGNKGLGKEIARQLGLKGFTVVISARNMDLGKVAVEDLKSAGCDAHLVKLEVSNAADVAALPAYFESDFGGIDVLINNAGIALEWDGQPTNVDKVRRSLEINLVAPYAISEALQPVLVKSSDARIINHSSALGSIGIAQNDWGNVATFMTVGYSCSKAGLNMLTQIQAQSWADRGIAVAAAHPGWAKTDLGSDAAPMEVAEGAETVVELASMPREEFPVGQLVHKGKALPW